MYQQRFRLCPSATRTVNSNAPYPAEQLMFASFAFCGEQVHDWARISPEMHAILATDLVLYDFALDVFKQQTAESLGTKWEY